MIEKFQTDDFGIIFVCVKMYEIQKLIDEFYFSDYMALKFIL